MCPAGNLSIIVLWRDVLKPIKWFKKFCQKDKIDSSKDNSGLLQVGLISAFGNSFEMIGKMVATMTGNKAVR